MKDFLLSSLTDVAALSISTIILNNVVALLISGFIMFTYWLTYSGTAYSKKFNVSLGMLVIVTAMVMSVISNNIALSLGMVGALSIIRFRTAVKDVRDATFIFWGIAVGICCGVSQYVLAAIGCVTIFIFLFALHQFSPDAKYLLIIRCSLSAQNKVEAAVNTYFDQDIQQTMKNASQEFCEIIYTMRLVNIHKAKAKVGSDIVEKLLKIEGVETVNLVEQTDDIGR